MTVVEIISPARCRHCRYFQRFNKGKLIRHRCSNPLSEHYGQKYSEKTRTLKDLACKHFEL